MDKTLSRSDCLFIINYSNSVVRSSMRGMTIKLYGAYKFIGLVQ